MVQTYLSGVERGGLNLPFGVEGGGLNLPFGVERGGLNLPFGVERGGLNLPFGVQLGWLNTFLTKYIQLCLLPRIKYFGLPNSVAWPLHRNAKDEKSSLGAALKKIYISSVSSE